VVLVADKLKLERTAPVRIGHLQEVDVFVTDALPSADLRQLCATHQVEVIEVGARPPGEG
jgi:DeoR family transcriptional regulator, glycerol-3-phosphate regulon repressor